MPGGKHDVYILEVDGEYRARPAVAAASGKAIGFRNLLSHPVIIVFTPGWVKVRGASPGMENILLLGPGAKSNATQLDPLAEGVLAYEARVLVQAQTPGGVPFALVPVVGESGPKIIVDP